MMIRSTWAVARREYASFFRTPLGWVVLALFLLLSGYVFSRFTIQPGLPASMRDFFALWWRILIIITPAISMRLFSEEHRSGTIDPLMTSPAPEVSIVLGKYAGAVAFLLTCLAPTLIYAGVLLQMARPDPGPIIAGYLGVILLGMVQLAVGLLASLLTSSQTLAFLSTLFVLIGVEAMSTVLASAAPAPLDAVLLSLSTDLRIADFARGVLDTTHVAFFVIVSGWLLSVATLVLRARRWR
jgi:ABC-2 type transport system permease protein